MYAGCFRLLTLSEGFIKQISENTEAEMQELPMPFVLLEKSGAMTLIGDMLKCVIAILIVDAVFKESVSGNSSIAWHVHGSRLRAWT